jgi:hypothetical protein
LKYLSILKLKKGSLILIKNHPNIRKEVIIELLPLEKKVKGNVKELVRFKLDKDLYFTSSGFHNAVSQALNNGVQILGKL